MGEAKLKQARAAAEARRADRRLEQGLKESFPASDPAQETQPGHGVTSLEPPPAGQKTGKIEGG